MQEIYPRGTPRTVVLERHGRGSTVWDCRVTDCDVLVVLRGAAGSSVGAAGIFWDYVLYDAEDRVIAAYRRRVD